MGGTGRSELGKDARLELDHLRHGFNDHVDVAQRVHFGGGSDAAAHRIGILARDLLLGDIFGEQLVGKGEPLVQGGLRGVNESDGHLSSAGSYEGNAQALRDCASVSCFSKPVIGGRGPRGEGEGGRGR